MVEHIAGRLKEYATRHWLSAVAAIMWVPAILMLSRVTRPKAPVLGLIGFVFTISLAAPSALDPYELAYFGLRSGLEVDAVVRLIDTAEQRRRSRPGRTRRRVW